MSYDGSDCCTRDEPFGKKFNMQETRVELGRLGQRSEHVFLFTLLMTTEAQVGNNEIFSSEILDMFSSFVTPLVQIERMAHIICS